jgi:hypothetical protein
MVSQTEIYFLAGLQLHATIAAFHEESGGAQALLTSAHWVSANADRCSQSKLSHTPDLTHQRSECGVQGDRGQFLYGLPCTSAPKGQRIYPQGKTSLDGNGHQPLMIQIPSLIPNWVKSNLASPASDRSLPR